MVLWLPEASWQVISASIPRGALSAGELAAELGKEKCPGRREVFLSVCASWTGARGRRTARLLHLVTWLGTPREPPAGRRRVLGGGASRGPEGPGISRLEQERGQPVDDRGLQGEAYIASRRPVTPIWGQQDIQQPGDASDIATESRKTLEDPSTVGARYQARFPTRTVRSCYGAKQHL